MRSLKPQSAHSPPAVTKALPLVHAVASRLFRGCMRRKIATMLMGVSSKSLYLQLEYRQASTHRSTLGYSKY